MVANGWQRFYDLTFRGWILTRRIPKSMLALPRTLVLYKLPAYEKAFQTHTSPGAIHVDILDYPLQQ